MAIQYENAPIKEALIDIRVTIPPIVTLDVLESLHDRIRDKYPQKKKRLYVIGQFSPEAEVPAKAERNVMGFVFSSEDEKQFVQARLDGFTFSRLRPYGNWIELRDESRRLWNIYRTTVNPRAVTRVAVRYVNQIDIPHPAIDYKDYFRTTPEVSPDLPQGLSGFFMQLQFPQEDFGGMLILTQTAIAPSEPNTNSVILDLDVFKGDTEIVEDEVAWQLLEKLRIRKNEFFEGSITPKTRELFGKRMEY